MLPKSFCEGKLTKPEKLELLQEYFRSGNMTSAEMIEDRKKVLKPILPSLFTHCSYYLFLGFGYAFVLNMFVKMPKSFFLLPALSTSVFGYYKYYELNEIKAEFVDRYEFELYKKYCKKGTKPKTND